MPITSHFQRQDIVLDGPLVWPGPAFLICACVPWGAQKGTSSSKGEEQGFSFRLEMIFFQVWIV